MPTGGGPIGGGPIEGVPTGCAIVLAAGAGRRAGAPKADYMLAGQRLVDRAVQVALSAGCEPVIAVVRSGTDVRGARVVVNPDPDQGLGSSLALGLVAAGETTADFAIVLLVDQPGIGPQAVRRLAAADGLPDDAANGRIWFATYAGVRDHPVRLDRPIWAQVGASAAGETGAKAFAGDHPDQVIEVACDDIADATDLDTAQALAAWSPR